MPENNNEDIVAIPAQPNIGEAIAQAEQAVLKQFEAQGLPAHKKAKKLNKKFIPMPEDMQPEPAFNDEDFGPPEEDEPEENFALKKKKMVFAEPFAESKTFAPGNIPRQILFDRARKIPRPKHPYVNNDTQCLQCSCRLSQHGSKKNDHCSRCENCPGGFLYQEQINRVLYTEFMRWAKRWIKASKKRDMKRLREIWVRIHNTGHLAYCGTCDTATFNNGLHGIVKRQEGLQCASCRQCSACCKCVACDQCRRRKRDKEICKTCKVCNQCCQCCQCPVCFRDASFNYCGYAFTDRQKKNDRGCGRCYKCCDCGDYCKVPFGSFAKPIFHKSTLKQHNINPTSRYIAAEIECAGIHGYGKPIYGAVRKWSGATVGDGSLAERGFEVNSAPAAGDLYVQQIQEVCAAIKLQNGFLDARCGLHVHVDARDMNYYDIRRFVRTYAAIEDGLFAMVSPQRIEGVVDDKGDLHQYCQPCGKKYVAAIEEGRLPYDKIKTDVITSVYSNPSTQNLRYRKRGNGIPRYNALNLHSWFYRGTIEARMFDGCIDPEPIINWGIMWAMIADYVVKSTDEQVAKDMVGKPLACLAKIVGGHKIILDFIKSRVLLFGNGQMRRDANELF
jgi:hypothetical protein